MSETNYASVLDQKRGEPLTVWSATIQKNEDGELFIELPNELTEKLNWGVGDTIEWDETEMLGNVFDDVGLTLRNLTQETDNRFSGHQYTDED